MERYTTERLKKIVKAIEQSIEAAKELEDGNPRSMATIISQTKVRTYRQCIKIIEAEMY